MNRIAETKANSKTKQKRPHLASKHHARKAKSSEAEFTLFGTSLSLKVRRLWCCLICVVLALSLLLIFTSLAPKQSITIVQDYVFLVFIVLLHIALAVLTFLARRGSHLVAVSAATLVLFAICFLVPARELQIKIGICEDCDTTATETKILNIYGRKLADGQGAEQH